jgi:hypothetical protein
MFSVSNEDGKGVLYLDGVCVGTIVVDRDHTRPEHKFEDEFEPAVRTIDLCVRGRNVEDAQRRYTFMASIASSMSVTERES